jgi:hypothetical protein
VDLYPTADLLGLSWLEGSVILSHSD